MLFYKLEYTIYQVTISAPTLEQRLVKELTGKSLDRKNAGQLWQRIEDHKWYISERLGRDIGNKVAALDYIENIYDAPPKKQISSSFKNGFRNALGLVTKKRLAA